jgi:hypothetical protein
MPYWDSRVQKFLHSMPEHFGRGLDFNPTKYPQKWMLKNKVDYPFHLQAGPHSYLYDVDPDWNIDNDILYGCPLVNAHYKDIIRKRPYEAILKPSHFNLAYLNKLADGYVKGKKVTGQERADLKNLVSLCHTGWY